MRNFPTPVALEDERDAAEVQEDMLVGAVAEELSTELRVACFGLSQRARERMGEDGAELLDLPFDQERAALRESLRRFKPQLVVLADAWTDAADPRALLETIVDAAPGARLAAALWNGASATATIEALAGERSRPWRLIEQDVHGWLAQRSFAVRRRVVLSTAGEGEPRLAADVERGLRSLLAQLNPMTADDRVVLFAGRSRARKVAKPRARGLLSVIIRNHSADRLALLDQAVFSLACQRYTPLEVVVATQDRSPAAVAALEALLGRHQAIGGFQYQVVRQAGEGDLRARLLNVGVEASRGQYIAFLDDDDVVYPQHYEDLIGALEEGDAGWAYGATRRAVFGRDADGTLYCKKKQEFPAPPAFSLPHFVNDNYIPLHAFVLDTSRLGRFPIVFSEELTRLEDYVFLLRLSALFRPVFVPGHASCEYRLRDDGSNSTPLESDSDERKRELEGEWNYSRAIKDAVKRKLTLLVRMGEIGAAGPDAGPARIVAPDELRYRLVDEVNTRFKERAPGIHAVAKVLLSKLLS